MKMFVNKLMVCSVVLVAGSAVYAMEDENPNIRTSVKDRIQQLEKQKFTPPTPRQNKKDDTPRETSPEKKTKPSSKQEKVNNRSKSGKIDKKLRTTFTSGEEPSEGIKTDKGSRDRSNSGSNEKKKNLKPKRKFKSGEQKKTEEKPSEQKKFNPIDHFHKNEELAKKNLEKKLKESKKKERKSPPKKEKPKQEEQKELKISQPTTPVVIEENTPQNVTKVTTQSTSDELFKYYQYINSNEVKETTNKNNGQALFEIHTKNYLNREGNKGKRQSLQALLDIDDMLKDLETEENNN